MGHLSDKGFASPVVDAEAEAAKQKEEAKKRDIDLVVKEYEEKQRKKKEKRKEKDDAKDKGKDKKEKKAEAEDDAKEEKEKDEKVSLGDCHPCPRSHADVHEDQIHRRCDHRSKGGSPTSIRAAQVRLNFSDAPRATQRVCNQRPMASMLFLFLSSSSMVVDIKNSRS